MMKLNKLSSFALNSKNEKETLIEHFENEIDENKIQKRPFGPNLTHKLSSNYYTDFINSKIPKDNTFIGESNKTSKNFLNTNRNKTENKESVSSSKKQNIKVLKEKDKKTFYDVISDFYIARTFIDKLKNMSRFRLPDKLKLKHFLMINDWSYFHKISSKKRVKEIY